jgi:sugar/nucleoside kinase (ribokinase family)
MSAAYISAVLEGASTEEAVRFGCAAGTVCAEHRGASAFTLRREDIAEVLEKM